MDVNKVPVGEQSGRRDLMLGRFRHETIFFFFVFVDSLKDYYEWEKSLAWDEVLERLRQFKKL